MGKRRHQVFSSVFDRYHFILAGNYDIDKSLNEFDIRRDGTMDYGALERLKNRLIMEKKTSSYFLSYFSSDLFNTCRQSVNA